MSHSDLKQLLLIIERQLDWGNPSEWQSRDFEILNELILEKTKVSLSASTLRRIWGRVEYNHLPSGTTLDTLSRFAGFDNWRAFTKRNGSTLLIAEPPAAPVAKPSSAPRPWFKVVLFVAAVVISGMAGIFMKKADPPINKDKFTFYSHPVTRSIPNSVIFTYDARVSPTDSVFIQQSWDPQARSKVDKDNHQFTSIYFRPGVYHAKLVVNNQIVKEHRLIIPTDGWLALIGHEPVPVYLDKKEFMYPDRLQVAVPVITQKNIPLDPVAPYVEFFNIGNFKPVSLQNFSFSTLIKDDFEHGSSPCQAINVYLFTDGYPIIIPMSKKGCVSDISVLNGYDFSRGKTNDLSGFGADMSQWQKLGCKANGNKIEYYVNDKLVFTTPMPPYKANIVGMSFGFQGTGAVKEIRLKDGAQTTFQAF